MNKQLLFILILSMIFLTGNAYPHTGYLKPFQGACPTDEEVRDFAIEKGILPEDLDSIDTKKEMEAGNSMVIWLMTDREKKIVIIDAVKQMFQKKEDVIISKSASYYVDEMNGVLYNSIENGDIANFKGRGVGNIFKTIAIMDGDFDNGQDRVELFKEWLGEDILELYREEFPDRYEKLLKIRQETIKKLSNKQK
jgi:hypothetical protein